MFKIFFHSILSSFQTLHISSLLKDEFFSFSLKNGFDPSPILNQYNPEEGLLDNFKS